MKGDYNLYKQTISHSAWRTYHEKYPEGLDYWAFRRLLSDVSTEIIEEVISNPMGFQLPGRLGVLIMVGYKPSYITRSAKMFKKLDYARTGNIIYQMLWIRNRKYTLAKNILLFNFKTAKLHQNRITAAIREDKFFNWLVLKEIKDKKFIDI